MMNEGISVADALALRNTGSDNNNGWGGDNGGLFYLSYFLQVAGTAMVLVMAATVQIITLMLVAHLLQCKV